MKKSLLQYLRCPTCKGDLNLIIKEAIGNEIKEGSLICRCGKEYAITNYIPRFVEGDRYVSSFSYQWETWRSNNLPRGDMKNETEEYFFRKTGFLKAELACKVILDVGCGTGRFCELVANYGGEVIGVDLSYSVDVAFENMRRDPRISFVQADLFHLPFADQAFDLIYSIGVLHHTPDCKQAFKQLPRLLKKGGQISIWVYSVYTYLYNKFSAPIRKITIKLPKKLLYYLCYISVPIYYIRKIPVIGILSMVLPVTTHKNWRLGVEQTFDWYAPRYQSKHAYPEVFKWFEEEGLKEIRILDDPVSVTGKRI